MRSLTAALAILVLVVGLSAQQSGPDRLTGNWKVSFLDGNELLTFWLLKLEVKNGVVSGTVDVAEGSRAKLQDVRVQGDSFSFAMLLDQQSQPLRFTFIAGEKDAKRLAGTLAFEGTMLPAQLEATKDDTAKDILLFAELPVPKGEFKDLKDEIAKRANEIGVFSLSHNLIEVAAAAKVPVADLKTSLAPAFQAAKNHETAPRVSDGHSEAACRLAGLRAVRRGAGPASDPRIR